MDDLKELKYHSEYGLILLMGISKTSDFGRFFQMKETKDVSFTCTLIYKGKLFKVNYFVLSLGMTQSLWP